MSLHTDKSFNSLHEIGQIASLLSLKYEILLVLRLTFEEVPCILFSLWQVSFQQLSYPPLNSLLIILFLSLVNNFPCVKSFTEAQRDH